MFPGQTHQLEGFKNFAGRLTMLRGIKETGLVISDGFSVYLLSGLDFKDFTVNKLADFPAIQGTDVKIDGSQARARISRARWSCGFPRKEFARPARPDSSRHFTLDYYHPVSTNEGTAILREAQGHYQYLVTQGGIPQSVRTRRRGLRGGRLVGYIEPRGSGFHERLTISPAISPTKNRFQRRGLGG